MIDSVRVENIGRRPYSSIVARLFAFITAGLFTAGLFKLVLFFGARYGVNAPIRARMAAADPFDS
jgi:hypothetical protein